jgi:putative hydroxymethylpyrimidine transport system substrate-binding protein
MQRHKDPTVTPVDQLGIPTYDELVFVAQASRLKDDSEPIRLFLAAMARGTAAAEKDPKGATQALLEQNHNLDPKLTAAEVKATLPVLSQGSRKRPYGYMNQAEWQQFIGWMRDHGLISSLPTPPQVLTEELLPGSIPG